MQRYTIRYDTVQYKYQNQHQHQHQHKYEYISMPIAVPMPIPIHIPTSAGQKCWSVCPLRKKYAAVHH